MTLLAIRAGIIIASLVFVAASVSAHAAGDDSTGRAMFIAAVLFILLVIPGVMPQ